MPKGEQELPELVRAAAALDRELVALESLSRSVRKIRLNSEKSITKAARELQEVLALPERLGEGLQTLAAAMAQMQARQQAALEPLSAFASEIQSRMRRLSEHMQAFSALGATATEVNALIQSSNGDHHAVMAQVDSRLTELAGGARALFAAASADDFPEVAREADALKQRMLALRKRLEPKN